MELEKRVEQLEKEVAELKKKLEQPLDVEKMKAVFNNFLERELSETIRVSFEDNQEACKQQ